MFRSLWMIEWSEGDGFRIARKLRKTLLRCNIFDLLEIILVHFLNFDSLFSSLILTNREFHSIILSLVRR